VPRAEWDDAVAEGYLGLCAGLKGARGRGTTAVNARFYAQNALAVVLHTRRGRALQALGGAGAAVADRNPGPAEEAEAAELLPALLARLPGEQLRRVVRLRAEGLAVREVAARVGLSRQRVEQLLLEARGLLLAR
jgi:DNA-directed RNA polymerase specialized sigma24 family protein